MDKVGSSFNSDELAAQALAGGGPRGDGIENQITDQHRHFFAQLPYLFVGVTDAAGWPIATLLTGAPGFVQSPEASSLRIAALPHSDDPAEQAFAPEREIGILGIDLATRRRNRANGRVVTRDLSGIEVAVKQSFGNCPQYIQRRIVSSGPIDAAGGAPSATEAFTHLDGAARSLIERADTFFVASRSRDGSGSAHGADISHRGGRPGFIRVDGDALTIPDFRGNHYFNTLGNFIAEPRASLLFVDFETGDLLQLQGIAQVDWHAAADFTGAERLWTFQAARGWRRSTAATLRWQFVDYSRVTAATGVWH